VDDNGTRAAAKSMKSTWTSTPPKASLEAPKDAAEPHIQPDGDGSKDSLTLRQSGSQEDLWTARVLDAAGTAVRTQEYTASAPRISPGTARTARAPWCRTACTPTCWSPRTAGPNGSSSRIDNIVVNTQQPPYPWP
jgi:hypothetical protein